MSTDKENVRPKSKIPVPKEKPLLRRAFRENESPNANQRNPLRTIANENVDQNCVLGPSRDTPVLDTRYVTYRINKEELDWNSEIFKDAVTPAPLPQSVRKKVKRSLKRPHCIGQLNLETKSASLNYPLELQNVHQDPLSRRYALDNLEHLLKTEKITERPRIRTASRACVINWILKVHVIQPYLDKYLSSSLVTASRMQLITAACFWIATKVDDSFVSGQRMVEYSGNAFNRNELVAAERNILRKFNFEVQAVVPQDFIPYFSWWCGQAQCADVEAAATFICLCGLIVDETLNREYPSVIAAAAVKVSLALLFKSIRVAQLHTCPIYKAAEKKSRNISTTCDQLYSALRVIRSSKSEYETLLDKYAGNYIVSKIFEHL